MVKSRPSSSTAAMSLAGLAGLLCLLPGAAALAF